MGDRLGIPGAVDFSLFPLQTSFIPAFLCPPVPAHCYIFLLFTFFVFISVFAYFLAIVSPLGLCCWFVFAIVFFYPSYMSLAVIYVFILCKLPNIMSHGPKKRPQNVLTSSAFKFHENKMLSGQETTQIPPFFTQKLAKSDQNYPPFPKAGPVINAVPRHL